MSHNLVQLRTRRFGPSVIETPLQRLRALAEGGHRISSDDLRAVARATGTPEAEVHGVATYYADLGLGPRGRRRVRVCRGSACHAAAGDAPMRWMEKALGVTAGETAADGSVSLEPVYCLGLCHAAPAAEVDGRGVSAVDEAVCEGIARGATRDDAHESCVPRFEVHDGPAIVLERLSRGVDARSLEVARAGGALEGLARARSRPSDDVLGEVERSELRGRGGAGFPTGKKWRLTAEHARRADAAYVVCNADEGDPGAFVDEWILERDPFAVLEGLAIAGHAIGARRGFVYVRSEYPRAAPILEAAIRDLRAAGLLGPAFDVEVVVGAGSYVCGEETALLRSLEGLRGTVTARPPYPAERGLFGKPTLVQNVETLASLGWILRHGGSAYAAIGVGRSRGTKVFSLSERFARPGLYEVPLGTSLRRLLLDLGGGLRDGRPIGVVQIGGPLGGILPGTSLDVALGFEELEAVSALLGHGGVVAWDDRARPLDVAVHLFEFCDAESCGKCFPCRIGSRRGLEIVRRLRDGEPSAAAEADRRLLDELLETMALGSLCAHGGGLPLPIRGLLHHFPLEMRGPT